VFRARNDGCQNWMEAYFFPPGTCVAPPQLSNVCVTHFILTVFFQDRQGVSAAPATVGVRVINFMISAQWCSTNATRFPTLSRQVFPRVSVATCVISMLSAFIHSIDISVYRPVCMYVCMSSH